MTNDAFIDIFGMGLDSAAIVMVEFQLRAVGDMGDQLTIRLRSMRFVCALNGSPRIFVQGSQPMAILATVEIS